MAFVVAFKDKEETTEEATTFGLETIGEFSFLKLYMDRLGTREFLKAYRIDLVTNFERIVEVKK